MPFSAPPRARHLVSLSIQPSIINGEDDDDDQVPHIRENPLRERVKRRASEQSKREHGTARAMSAIQNNQSNYASEKREKP